MSEDSKEMREMTQGEGRVRWRGRDAEHTGASILCARGGGTEHASASLTLASAGLRSVELREVKRMAGGHTAGRRQSRIGTQSLGPVLVRGGEGHQSFHERPIPAKGRGHQSTPR